MPRRLPLDAQPAERRRVIDGLSVDDSSVLDREFSGCDQLAQKPLCLALIAAPHSAQSEGIECDRLLILTDGIDHTQIGGFLLEGQHCRSLVPVGDFQLVEVSHLSSPHRAGAGSFSGTNDVLFQIGDPCQTGLGHALCAQRRNHGRGINTHALAERRSVGLVLLAEPEKRLIQTGPDTGRGQDAPSVGLWKVARHGDALQWDRRGRLRRFRLPIGYRCLSLWGSRQDRRDGGAGLFDAIRRRVAVLICNFPGFHPINGGQIVRYFYAIASVGIAIPVRLSCFGNLNTVDCGKSRPAGRTLDLDLIQREECSYRALHRLHVEARQPGDHVLRNGYPTTPISSISQRQENEAG